jgi:hypothetical protein
VFEACTPYLFESGPLRVLTDPRWFSTMPGSGEGAALLELRRWPGDSVLALYAIAGPPSRRREVAPPVPAAKLELQPGGTEEADLWRGEVATAAGPRPVVWIERKVEQADAYLGALLLPGDAGLGGAAIADLTDELVAVYLRVEIIAPAWKARSGLPHGQWIQMPETGDPPGDRTEEDAPWQVIQGGQFTLGLPPGFRARRWDETATGGDPPPGGLLWIRGRVVDVEGTEVVVGDAERAGYVALIDTALDEWAAGKQPPVGAPRAEPVKSEPFPIAAERTGARRARAGRWREAGFDGEWLVFRLRLESRGVELALPVVAGRRSPTLFWIPLTWRGANEPPAPPPVDPAEKFGIRFEEISRAEQQRRPWTEGFLAVPGLRAEVPKGWYPAASLRSSNGYPVRFVESGTTLGHLTRLAPGELPDLDGASGWVRMDWKGARVESAFERNDGSYLLVTKQGHAFLFESTELAEEHRELWRRMVGSVQLMRSGP